MLNAPKTNIRHAISVIHWAKYPKFTIKYFGLILFLQYQVYLSVCPPFWTCPYGLNLAAARFGVTLEAANNERNGALEKKNEE